MNRTEYQTAHRNLRRTIRSAAPDASPWKQPLAAGHHAQTVAQAVVALRALTGAPYRLPSARQQRLDSLVRYCAILRARRHALAVYKAAGADEADLRSAKFRMEAYGMNPSDVLARAAALAHA